MKVKKKILVNQYPWQTRVAITSNNTLENIYFESHSTEQLERCFFRGIVTKILPGIQTAFVDIGHEHAGFLHISEIDLTLSIKQTRTPLGIDEIEYRGSRTKPGARKSDISKILKEREAVLVQVSKEPINEKGAKLTTCFTLPGRFLVLMPNIPKIGISKKIGTIKERNRLRQLLTENLPEGMGAIIRTTSEGKDSKEILQDLQYLVDTWNTIIEKFKTAKPCEKIYQDLDLSLQVVRDYLDDDVEYVISDNKQNHDLMYKFISNVAPEHSFKVRHYTAPPPIFKKYDVEQQIENALQKKVYLKSGGSIIIDMAEAMTVIDVNTGRYIGKKSLQETILKTNMEAAEEITRQLRLRNIGGLIVIDFIDMRGAADKDTLFKFFEKTLRERDKFQSVLLKISEFGLVQMTRKRSGKTLLHQLTDECSTCHGLGLTKSIQNESYAIFRKLDDQLASKDVAETVNLNVHPSVFDYISTYEYNAILHLEKKYSCKIMVSARKNCLLNFMKIT